MLASLLSNSRRPWPKCADALACQNRVPVLHLALGELSNQLDDEPSDDSARLGSACCPVGPVIGGASHIGCRRAALVALCWGPDGPRACQGLKVAHLEAWGAHRGARQALVIRFRLHWTSARMESSIGRCCLLVQYQFQFQFQTALAV